MRDEVAIVAYEASVRAVSSQEAQLTGLHTRASFVLGAAHYTRRRAIFRLRRLPKPDSPTQYPPTGRINELRSSPHLAAIAGRARRNVSA
jgi:hypothetical protein